jgi:hypothetical protein
MITVDVLDTKNWWSYGTGNVQVNAGTGTVNVNIKITAAPPKDLPLVVSAWSIDANLASRPQPWTLACVTTQHPVTVGASPPPPPPPVDKPFSSLGCGIDGQRRALDGAQTAENGMTAQVCYNFCKPKGFKYFGTQYSRECFCGNALFSQGRANEGECNSRCAGDNNQFCGGSWRLNFYEINGVQGGGGGGNTAFCPSRCRINGDNAKFCQPPGCPPCKRQNGNEIDCVNFNGGTTTCPGGYTNCQPSGGRLEDGTESGLTTGQTVGIAVGVSIGVLFIVIVVVAGLWLRRNKGNESV